MTLAAKGPCITQLSPKAAAVIGALMIIAAFRCQSRPAEGQASAGVLAAQQQHRQGRAQQENGCHAGPVEGEVTTALGSIVPASLYTLPRLWDQLKKDAQYDKRLAQVKAFNRDSVWLKRGISMTPCRYCHHMLCYDVSTPLDPVTRWQCCCS